ncbi:hypothetical protein ACHAXR_011564 [Thalassiosira sp. AJA248-18]
MISNRRRPNRPPRRPLLLSFLVLACIIASSSLAQATTSEEENAAAETPSSSSTSGSGSGSGSGRNNAAASEGRNPRTTYRHRGPPPVYSRTIIGGNGNNNPRATTTDANSNEAKPSLTPVSGRSSSDDGDGGDGDNGADENVEVAAKDESKSGDDDDRLNKETSHNGNTDKYQNLELLMDPSKWEFTSQEFVDFLCHLINIGHDDREIHHMHKYVKMQSDERAYTKLKIMQQARKEESGMTTTEEEEDEQNENTPKNNINEYNNKNNNLVDHYTPVSKPEFRYATDEFSKEVRRRTVANGASNDIHKFIMATRFHTDAWDSLMARNAMEGDPIPGLDMENGTFEGFKHGTNRYMEEIQRRKDAPHLYSKAEILEFMDNVNLAKVVELAIPGNDHLGRASPLMEYDLLKFDPYSFSGAPLGGWGRATRSRLATLPVRLVSQDFEGGVGMDLLYGSGVGEDEGDGDDEEEVMDEEGKKQDDKEEGSQVVSQDGNNESTETVSSSGEGQAPKEKKAASSMKKTSSSIPENLQRSTGPHYTIHDSTGQKYICRAYPEDELVILSKVDSIFHPAQTVWDAAAAAAAKSEEKNSGQPSSSSTTVKQLSEVDEEVRRNKQKVLFQINGNEEGAVVNGGDDLPEGLRNTVSKMLRKMGMNDAANALGRRQRLQDLADNPEAFLNGDVGNVANVEVDVRVVNLNGGGAAAVGGGGDVNDAMANEMAKIIKAAAVGAGMDSAKYYNENINDDGSSGNDSGNSKDLNTRKKDPTSFRPAQLTTDEISRILTHELTGLCSQLHLGWWSYEWCHQDQVRQFHVAVNNHPTHNGPKYTIEDITLVGKFDRKTNMQIIYPRGVYNGKSEQGTTQDIRFDLMGNTIHSSVHPHTPEDDVKYRLAYRPPDKVLDLENKQMMSKLGHGGPIIRQMFESGDYCEDAGHHRKMQVELRCCTEEEIDHWLESKKQRPKGSSNNVPATKPEDKAKKEETPQAVLVSVHEDATCSYRSRVCTPLICPRPVVTDTVASHAAAGGSSASKPTTTKTPGQISQETKKDPIGSLLGAIFGDDMNGNHGEVQVYFPNEETGQAFEELLKRAKNGENFKNDPAFAKVKEALRKSGGKKFDSKDLLGGDDVEDGNVGSSVRSASMMGVKFDQSVREILDNTLGKRSCLLKNLGWWTYEFCHTKQIRQYHANNLVDANTGFAKQTIETEHFLGIYENSGNSIKDYPNEEEHLHVINATGSAADVGIDHRRGAARGQKAGNSKNEKQPGGNGAVYLQEYAHGDVCDHADVAESVIKGGNVVHGSVERSSTVRFSCGKRWELIDIKEDSTCHYILDVTVPELCHHALFKAPVTKTQVVKCLPV